VSAAAAATTAATEPADGATASSSGSHTSASSVPAPQQPTDASSTHAQTASRETAGQRKQQHKGDSMPPIYDACRWTVSSVAWLLSLLPLMLLSCVGNATQGYVSKLMNGLCDLLLQKPLYREDGVVYYRLGRVHRSSGPSSDNAGRKLWLRVWHINFWLRPPQFNFWARARDIKLRSFYECTSLEHDAIPITDYRLPK
jgi:hypothetical protein